MAEDTQQKLVAMVISRACGSYEKLLTRQLNQTKIPLARQAIEKELSDLRSAMSK